jgi:ketosteroid isomerase-like protein
MALQLASPILAFFAASNRHDAGAIAGCFTPDALVHDENADHRGEAAIRDWADETHRKYGVSLTPRGVRTDGSTSVVATQVVGTFPGSPIELQFRFAIAGDRIAELVIG